MDATHNGDNEMSTDENVIYSRNRAGETVIRRRPLREQLAAAERAAARKESR